MNRDDDSSALPPRPGESHAAHLERLQRLHAQLVREIAELEGTPAPTDAERRPPGNKPRGAGGGVVTVPVVGSAHPGRDAPSDPRRASGETPAWPRTRAGMAPTRRDPPAAADPLADDAAARAVVRPATPAAGRGDWVAQAPRGAAPRPPEALLGVTDDGPGPLGERVLLWAVTLLVWGIVVAGVLALILR